MHLTRFEPWSVVDLMQRDFDRIVARRFGQSDVENPVADWRPAVDIIEEKSRFLLRADVPGVNPDDIDVSMDAGVITVSGERHAEAQPEDGGVRRTERSTGRFLRRFTLPDSADAQGITARSKNGILEVAIPKLPVVQARRITVEAA